MQMYSIVPMFHPIHSKTPFCVGLNQKIPIKHTEVYCKNVIKSENVQVLDHKKKNKQKKATA